MIQFWILGNTSQLCYSSLKSKTLNDTVFVSSSNRLYNLRVCSIHKIVLIYLIHDIWPFHPLFLKQQWALSKSILQRHHNGKKNYQIKLKFQTKLLRIRLHSINWVTWNYIAWNYGYSSLKPKWETKPYSIWRWESWEYGRGCISPVRSYQLNTQHNGTIEPGIKFRSSSSVGGS